jgi:glutamate--cysteine ligase
MVIELHADTSSAGKTGAGQTGTKLAGSAGYEPGSPLSETEAERLIGAICFKTGPPGVTGAELEWLVSDIANPLLSVPFERIRQVIASLDEPGVLPGAGLLTLEPGGQVELSTAPARNLSDCVAAASADLAVLHEAFGEAGLVLSGHGLDPVRPPRRVLELPRYAAMEQYFDRGGPWGRLMMCSTASVQVCVDAGLDDDGVSGYGYRWRLLHALGPVLVAAFANSPLRRGRPTGWKCTRQLVWSRLDPGRTLAPPGAEPRGPAASHPNGPLGANGSTNGFAPPRSAWVRYAMDADVLCVRQEDGGPWTVPAGLSFRDWLRGAARPGQLGPDCPRIPTADDLTYHLSTLFPPVRPRGHLELRMIDEQPGDGWIVPVAVVSALVDDPVAADAAMAAAEPVWRQHVPPPRATRQNSGRLQNIGRLQSAGRLQQAPWLHAAQHGPADPELARASRRCFEAADAALARAQVPPLIRNAVADFADRYVERGRCPADDLLDSIAITVGS